MRERKPFKIIEERRKLDYIVIKVFKRRKVFSYGLSTSIGTGGFCFPDNGEYGTFFEAKNTALHDIFNYFKNPFEQAILKKFRLMGDLDQPLLFYN
jgi:hypothetical protein